MRIKLNELRSIVRDELRKVRESYLDRWDRGYSSPEMSDDEYWESLEDEPVDVPPQPATPPGAAKSPGGLPGDNLRQPRGRSYREEPRDWYPGKD